MRFAPVPLAAAVFALSACASQNGVSTVGERYPLYKTAHNAYALNNRDVFVIVHGGGYAMDQMAFRQTVLDGMMKSRGGMNTRFTETPKNNYDSDYKIVMLFNGPITAQADDLCSKPEQFATLKPTVNGETHVLAAFCRYDAPLTGVNGMARGVTTPSDPKFASLLRATMTDLFPTVDDRPNRDSDSGSGGGDIP